MRAGVGVSVLLALLTVLAAVGASAGAQSDPRAFAFPQGEYVGDIDQVGFGEPSGIVFHPARGTLFVVGDEGDVCEIETDGKLIKQAHIRDADFEGVTCDPATGLLYVVIEGEERILEIRPDDLAVLREFDIERTFGGQMLLKPGGQGVEAITFRPDAEHPQGGTFYIGNQSFEADSEEDPSVICEVEVPLRASDPTPAPARIVRQFSLGIADLAALHYDATSNHLYVVSDTNNMLIEVTCAGEAVACWAFPGDNQEGLTIDPKGFVYVAQDSGGIIKFEWVKRTEARATSGG